MNDNLIERKAFADFLLGNYGDTYSQKDVDHYIEHNHVSWLAWKARAAIERQSVPAGYVRFCPECGTTGEVRSTARDCCPDGSHAAYMPEKTAEVCSKLFHDLLAAARQPQPVQEPVADIKISGDDFDLGLTDAFAFGRLRLPDGHYQLYTSPQAQAAHGITKGTT